MGPGFWKRTVCNGGDISFTSYEKLKIEDETHGTGHDSGGLVKKIFLFIKIGLRVAGGFHNPAQDLCSPKTDHGHRRSQEDLGGRLSEAFQFAGGIFAALLKNIRSRQKMRSAEIEEGRKGQRFEEEIRKARGRTALLRTASASKEELDEFLKGSHRIPHQHFVKR